MLKLMWTEIDLNESEFDLNELKHFLKANLDRCKRRQSYDVIVQTRVSGSSSDF